MDYKKIYESKLRTVDDALKLIKDGDVIFTSQAVTEPDTILKKLHTITEMGVKHVDVQNCFPIKKYEYFSNPKYKDNFSVESWYISSPIRKAQFNCSVSYNPSHARAMLKRKLYAVGDRRRVFLCSCSPMDKHGYLSLSLCSIFERDLIDDGALVICEVNKNRPRTFGDNIVHISEIAAVVEADYELDELPEVVIDETDKKIGQLIAELVEDGSTMQLGIGKIPNAVGEELKVKHHLGIHTEMFTESMVSLIECGAVDNSMKNLYKGFSVCTFAYGSKKLYDFLDDNPSVIFKSGAWTNNPYIIAQNNKFVSINTSLEIDLFGQCSSESIGFDQYTGTGGQADTAIGALMSKGGKSIIAVHSTAQIKGSDGEKETISKIVTSLKTGSAVSLSRNDIDYVVTEYGVVQLRGLSIADRAKALISIAHPDFRDKLYFDAKANHLI